jgi:hypothetical protein
VGDACTAVTERTAAPREKGRRVLPSAELASEELEETIGSIGFVQAFHARSRID